MKIINLIISLIMTMTASACNHSDDDHIEKGEQDPAQPVLSEKGRFDLSKGTNGNPPVIKLSSGYDMPIVGLGTYSLHGDKCVNAILSSIRLGYRKFDTASFYGNEEEVGQAIRQAIEEGLIKREDVFVTTKLYPNEFADAEKNIEKCLRKLDIGYIDLMLLHHPGSHDVEAYRTMERYVREGKIRSLGVSNYYIKEMSEFLPKVNIKPVLDQNEIHPYYQDKAVIEYLHDNGIVVEAWYPLGGRGFNSELMKEPVIMDIARRHGKSLVQTILRWDLQNGVVVIPGSSNPDHQKENISIFDFELTPEEMGRIDALERREKHDWY